MSRYVDIDETDDTVLDMMAPNVGFQSQQVASLREAEPGMFKFEKNGTSLDLEAFMAQPLTIEIHTTTDENAPPVVFVGVNGDTRWLPRGKRLKIQRKFVERLAQIKEARYATSENPDRSADNGMVTKRVQASPYGFSVLHDPDPRGRAWLAQVSKSHGQR